VHYFPDPDHPDLAPFTRAFVRLLFAHADFERRVSELLGIISGDPDFGERPKNRWSAKTRPAKMRQLGVEKATDFPGGLPELDEIVGCLRRSIPPSNERNFLAHGTWWEFDVESGLITVRAATAWPNEEQHRRFTLREIQNVADLFGDLEAELYLLQRPIEQRVPD